MKPKAKSKKPLTPKPSAGDRIYVPSRWFISRGSADTDGGEATIDKIWSGVSGGEYVWFISVKELPDVGFNWCQILKPDQAKLKKEYKGRVAKPNPDIDTPW